MAGSSNGPDIQIGCSNLALPLALQLRGDVLDYERHLTAIDADTLEVTPERSTFVSRLRHCARFTRVVFEGWGELRDYDSEERNVLLREHAWKHGIDLDERPGPEGEFFQAKVGSVHSSFRKEGSVSSRGRARIFPTWRESLEWMQDIQLAAEDRGTALEHISKPDLLSEWGLPAVLYVDPEESGEAVRYNDTNAPFRTRGFQPKAQEWRNAWHLSDRAGPDDLKVAMTVSGLDEVVADLFHLQVGFREPADVVRRLSAAGLIGAVHLSLGRRDSSPKHSTLRETTMQARKAFMESPEAARRTLEGAMLLKIVHDWKKDPKPGRRIILEEMPGISQRKAVRQQRAILEITRALVRAA